MSAITITITGNLTGDPEMRFTPNGTQVATFTVAANERYRDNSGQWQDGPTSFLKVHAWRDLADHAAESLHKGDRVIVTGQLRQRSYEVEPQHAKDNGKRSVFEVSATEIGAALRYATAKISKVKRDGSPVPEDPWSASAPVPDGPADDEPPF